MNPQAFILVGIIEGIIITAIGVFFLYR